MKSEKLKVKNLLLIFSLVLAALTIGGALWSGRTVARAITPSQSIVDKLTERFDLNKDEVAGLFDEMRQEREQKMQAYMESRLNETVKDGVITAEQRQALLNKHQEMWEKQNQLRQEMRQWMEQSGIDFEKLAPYGGFGHHMGFGPGHGFLKGL